MEALRLAAKKLEEELGKALASSCKLDANWVNLRNSYFLALSIRRLLEGLSEA